MPRSVMPVAARKRFWISAWTWFSHAITTTVPLPVWLAALLEARKLESPLIARAAPAERPTKARRKIFGVDPQPTPGCADPADVAFTAFDGRCRCGPDDRF